MNPRTLRILLLAAWALVVGVALMSVRNHERTLADGEIVLLALAPVDPRSLMQGDYMALRFAVAQTLQENLRQESTSGLPTHTPNFVYLTLDAERRAAFAGSGDMLRAEANTISIRVRDHGQGLSIGPNAFFFQEGTADAFNVARWGEFRVAPDGTALLTHMRDDKLIRLGSAKAYGTLN